MKLAHILFLILFFVGCASAQETMRVMDEYQFEQNYCADMEIKTTESFFEISTYITALKIDLEGKKQVLISPNEQYAAIINFAFPDGKENYPIDMYVFDNEGTEILRTSITGYYDMPHPLYIITDGGDLVGFDPLYAKFLITDENGTEKVPLIENAEFEMERAGFIAASENKIFVAMTNLAYSNNGIVAVLYKYDMQTKEMESEPLPFNNLMCMELLGDDIFISVLLEENGNYELAYSAYDAATLKQEFLKRGKGIELIAPIDNGFVATYSNKFYLMNQDYDIVKTEELEGSGRIQTIMPAQDATYFLFTNAEYNYSFVGKIQNDFTELSLNGLKNYQTFFTKIAEKENTVYVNGDGMSVEVK